MSASARLLTPPSSLTVDLVGEKEVILLWEDASEGVATEYIIYKSAVAGSEPSELKRLPATETTFVDSDVAVGGVYTYRVSAAAPGFTAAASEPVSIRVTHTLVGNDGGQTGSGTQVSAPLVTGSDLLELNSSNFWPVFLLSNAIAIGVLLSLFMLLRNFIWRQPKPITTAASKADWELKLGEADKPILEEAVARYKNKTRGQMQEWQDLATQEDLSGRDTH